MTFLHRLAALTAILFAWLLASCATGPDYSMGPDGGYYDDEGERINPFEPGTYQHFKAEPEYPKTKKVWKNEPLLAVTTPMNARIVISIAQQRGFLLHNNEVVIDYPVSTGTSSHPTPPGDYQILEKEVDKYSNAYGKVYDAEGNLVPGVETPDEVPEGGEFKGAPMPYWMRLTWDGVGHHIGNVPRYPASHACIRGPRSVVPTIYSKVKKGTPVSILRGPFAGETAPVPASDSEQEETVDALPVGEEML